MYHTIFIYHLLSVLVDVTMGGKFDYYKDVIHFIYKVSSVTDQQMLFEKNAAA